MNAGFNAKAYRVPSDNRTTSASAHLAPRTIAKMREMDYLSLARQRFLENLPFCAPAEVVEANIKSIADWCYCLNEARSDMEN